MSNKVKEQMEGYLGELDSDDLEVLQITKEFEEASEISLRWL